MKFKLKYTRKNDCLTGVKCADNENMHKETKHFLITNMRKTGQDIKLEPAWRKSTNNWNRTEHVQCCNTGSMKKKRNPTATDSFRNDKDKIIDK